MHPCNIINVHANCDSVSEHSSAFVVQAAKISSVMDFLEKPEKQSETDKAEKVKLLIAVAPVTSVP